MKSAATIKRNASTYWNAITSEYNADTRISLDDFHYGPLLPGDSELKLLPEIDKGMRCLEIGCGAAQNSIFLAKNGARCTAIDISSEMLKHGQDLARQCGVEVKLINMAMEDIEQLSPQRFKLIFSSYALCFSPSPGTVVQKIADLLEPGGTFIFSTSHPLFGGEWLELDGEYGLFLPGYFKQAPDRRTDDRGRELVRSSYYPLGEMADWCLNAGLRLDKIMEPRPSTRAPYASKAWEEFREQLERFPATVIFKASKPSG